jgi:hypothetical protein
MGKALSEEKGSLYFVRVFVISINSIDIMYNYLYVICY